MTNLLPYQDDPLRVAALMRYRDLDYSNAPEFETITQLIADICEVPMSALTFVDIDEVKLLFTYGIKGVTSVPRDISFCEKTIFQSNLLEIPDTHLHPEFKQSPLVIEDPKIRFYTGIPLLTDDGYAIGTMCVMGQQPKILSSSQKSSLIDLGKVVTKLLESKLIESLSRTNESFVKALDEIVYDHDICGKKIKWSGAYTRILGFNKEEMGADDQSWLGKVHPDDLTAVLNEYETVKKEHRLYDLEYRFARHDGNYIWVHDRGVMHFDEDGQAIQTIGIIRDINRRKLIELKLKEREARYSSLVNNALVCIHEIDLQKALITMNPAGLKMMGVNDENEICGKPYLDVVSQKDKKRIENLLLSAYQGHESEFEFMGANGEIYSSCFIPIKDSQGSVIKLMGVSENITIRKKAEEKLKIEMERLELVMRATNDCVWDLNKQNDSVWWNETYTKTFGRPENENTWDWWIDRIHPEDRDRVRDSLASLPESGKARWYKEYRFQKPDGSFAYVQDRAYIARDETGKTTRILGAMRDITKLKHAEQDLREINIALTHALPGIARLDMNGCYTYVNEIYADLLGYTPEELIGQSWKVTVDPDDIDKGEHGYRRMLAEDNVEFDIKGLQKDGSLIFKHVLIAKRVDDKGDFIGHLCFMKNITEQIQAEKQHKQLQNEIAHVARLSNMNELAAGLAHELNQPLTAISHYCDAAKTMLASEPIVNDDLMEIFHATSEQVHRAGEIIRHCRQFTSKQVMEKCLANLNELTKETVRFLESDAQDHNASIQLTLDEKLPAIEIDKVQIQQVLVNLIRNGLEAMENGNDAIRKLTVCTHINGKNSNKPDAQVTVKDSGPGITNKQIDKLFQPFYTTKTNGMGMGLSISRSIIEAHGGKLWVDNQHNKETRFHFTLPVNAE